jgi:hypothetical protein
MRILSSINKRYYITNGVYLQNIQYVLLFYKNSNIVLPKGDLHGKKPVAGGPSDGRWLDDGDLRSLVS